MGMGDIHLSCTSLFPHWSPAYLYCLFHAVRRRHPVAWGGLINGRWCPLPPHTPQSGGKRFQGQYVVFLPLSAIDNAAAKAPQPALLQEGGPARSGGLGHCLAVSFRSFLNTFTGALAFQNSMACFESSSLRPRVFSGSAFQSLNLNTTNMTEGEDFPRP